MRPMLLKTMIAGTRACGIAALLAMSLPVDAAADAMSAALERFARQDAMAPPPPGGVVFTGSSSIERWDLAQSFPGSAALNRGIGGIWIAHVRAHLDELALRYRPRVIVLYAGDNDLADGRSPAEVVADFRSILERVRAVLPDARLVFVGIKPSLARWKLIEAVREANGHIRDLCARDERSSFIDVETPMTGSDGRPRRELFVADGLHLSPAGYALWTSLVSPWLDDAASQPAAGRRANQP